MHEPTSLEAPLCACAELCSEDCPVVEEGHRYPMSEPGAELPVMLVRGGGDPRICPWGGCGEKGFAVATVEEQLQFWLDANGCDAQSFSEQSIVETGTLRSFESCEGRGSVAHVYDPDLGHRWRPSYDAPVMAFLQATVP